MQESYFTRHPHSKDVLQFIGFIALVFIGTILINTFIFRSFAVSGHSMDKTLADGQRLIVNRIPITMAQAQNKSYVPSRGQIIVFENPHYVVGMKDRYLVKRVIAFPGERVTVENGVLTVFNKQHPAGFNPDTAYRKDGVGPQSPVSGDGLDVVVPEKAVFVCGDNRIGDNSYDSRIGLGSVPLFDIVGPVAVRVFPLNSVKAF